MNTSMRMLEPRLLGLAKKQTGDPSSLAAFLLRRSQSDTHFGGRLTGVGRGMRRTVSHREVICRR